MARPVNGCSWDVVWRRYRFHVWHGVHAEKSEKEMTEEFQHPDSCFCFECLGPSQAELISVSKELFVLLMNRIYNASDFDRLGPVSERERTAIDVYLQTTRGKNEISTTD